jgi:hypothetical protein
MAASPTQANSTTLTDAISALSGGSAHSWPTAASWRCVGRGAARTPAPRSTTFNIGPLPAASGRKVVLSGHTAVRLEDGMVAEEAVWSTQRKAQLRCITGGLLL